MIQSKTDCTNGDTSGNLTSGQLLSEIEAISKALYLHKPTHHQFAGKVQFPNYGIIGKPKSDREKLLKKVSRRSSSASSWNWKKPLKALSHLRDRKLSCSFFLYVHSIEGLPANFNNYSLSVQFGRKNEVITTRKSQVLKGMADFDETLMHRCSVYCHRSGQDNSCKYDPKIFLIQASVVGAWGLDIGKHWVDLTRLLPLTLEELEGEKSSGKWTTTFKLAGKAKGAILNVSFGYLLKTESLVECSGNLTVSQLIDLACRSNVKQDGARLARFDSSGTLSRSESDPSNLKQGSVPLLKLIDGKTRSEVLIPPASELSKSIHFLYQKLNEGDSSGSVGSEASAEHPGRQKPVNHTDLELAKQTEADENEEIEFEIIDKGVELEVPPKEESSVAERNVLAHNVYGTEMVQVDEIFMGNNTNHGDEVNYNSDRLSCLNQKQGVCAEKLVTDELLSDFRELLILESRELNFHGASEEFDSSNYLEVKSSYKGNKLAKRSLSLDDISESVASDFLDMLEHEVSMPRCNSDCDPESPRERLLRDFEKEGNFLLRLDETVDDAESSAGAAVESDLGDDYEDYMLDSLLEAATEEELDMESHSLRRRRKAIMLEDLETEALMREWGFDEKTFLNSLRCRSSSGFGSPIELDPEEEQLKSPALVEDLGLSMQTEG